MPRPRSRSSSCSHGVELAIGEPGPVQRRPEPVARPGEVVADGRRVQARVDPGEQHPQIRGPPHRGWSCPAAAARSAADGGAQQPACPASSPPLARPPAAPAVRLSPPAAMLSAMRLALKPGLLPVWRDDDTLQIGIDPRRAVAVAGIGRAAALIGLLDGSRDRAGDDRRRRRATASRRGRRQADHPARRRGRARRLPGQRPAGGARRRPLPARARAGHDVARARRRRRRRTRPGPQIRQPTCAYTGRERSAPASPPCSPAPESAMWPAGMPPRPAPPILPRRAWARRTSASRGIRRRGPRDPPHRAGGSAPATTPAARPGGDRPATTARNWPPG